MLLFIYSFLFLSLVLKLDTSLHLQATCLKGAAAVGLAETPPVYCSADPYLHRYDRADSYKTRHFGFRIDPHNKVLIRPLSLCSSNLKHFQRIAAFIVIMKREYSTSSNVVVSPSLSEVFRKNLPGGMKKGLLKKKKSNGCKSILLFV